MPKHAGFGKRKYRWEENQGRRGELVFSTVCRGKAKVFYTEAIYPPAFSVGPDLMLCEYRCYAKMIGRVFCRGTAAPRCCEKTI